MSDFARRLWPLAGVMWPATWLGRRYGAIAGLGVVALVGVAALLPARRRLFAALAVAALAGTVAGTGARLVQQRAVESVVHAAGSVRLLGAVTVDPTDGRFGSRMVVVPVAIEQAGDLAVWRGPALEVQSEDPPDVRYGDRVFVEGRLRPGAGHVGRVEVAGRLSSARVVAVPGAEPGLVGFANAMRDRVLSGLDGSDGGQALLAGFLVGDTSGVGDADLEALRRAGLTHFVAVSGSNLATFLALWWLLLAPLARHPIPRITAGLIGVAVFVVITRAEPSVVRAGVMVSVLLVGRLFGLALDRWATLGLTVIVCLALAPGLADDVGFQLSVAATAGVMGGTVLFRFSPQPVANVLGATISAQVAVAPILLVTFGSLPLMAPIANLVAAPLVAVATVFGGLGALAHFGPCVFVGDLASEAVLIIGRVAAPWPQIGWVGVSVAAIGGLAAWRLPSLRVAIVVVAGLVAALAVAPFGHRVDPGTVAFLDVGQGDASLIFGEGVTVLVDGGPDPGVLAEKLAHWGVDHLDLVIVSHVHADHIEGLRAVVGRIPVGVVWLAFDNHSTPASEWLSGALAETGVPWLTPEVGSDVELGGIRLRVLGPLRHYASPNDESIVIEAQVSERSVLFTGDIEVIAQRELDGVSADVLKVPHQGAATSDADWLAAVGADIASISVGPNTFGHPADWVIEVLEQSGAMVMRTDRDGDVVVGPEGLASARPWWRLWP